MCHNDTPDSNEPSNNQDLIYEIRSLRRVIIDLQAEIGRGGPDDGST